LRSLSPGAKSQERALMPAVIAVMRGYYTIACGRRKLPHTFIGSVKS
jgi:hypothetical protein